ncbi:MAG TPA: 4Fe-4S binding protein [Bacteroidales bacterium]|nr:4Fe-4S binding protein [Bacteroidales bacterium]
MNPFIKYISGIFTALKALIGGLRVTWRELWRKKVTMQYPENRETLVISDRWRSELHMPHDENNEHACTACGICMNNCPNGTIKVTSNMEETEDGKKKRVLDKYVWDYGTCTFCNLCVITCPSDAIQFNNDFEGAMYDRSKLIRQLNKPGSKLREKEKVEKPAAPAKEAAKPTEAPAKKEEKKEIAPEAKKADEKSSDKENK